MKPGRELDALVAERIFGAKLINGEWVVKIGNFQSKSNILMNYSTDIAAAWEVVEKMQSKGYVVDISCYSVISNRRSSCVIYVQGEPWEKFDAESESAPEAICSAALKVVE